VNKPTLQTQVTAMKKYDWEDLTDEDIRDEITLVFQVITDIREKQTLSETDKQILIDDCLDNLNSLYNEQRKRSPFKRNFGTS
jgi:hypothetical protein